MTYVDFCYSWNWYFTALISRTTLSNNNPAYGFKSSPAKKLNKLSDKFRIRYSQILIHLRQSSESLRGLQPPTLNRATRFHGVSGIATYEMNLDTRQLPANRFCARNRWLNSLAGRGLAEFAHMRPGSLVCLGVQLAGNAPHNHPQRLGNSRRFIIVPPSACADTRPAVSTRIRLIYLRSRGSPINLAIILLQTIDSVQGSRYR